MLCEVASFACERPGTVEASLPLFVSTIIKWRRSERQLRPLMKVGILRLATSSAAHRTYLAQNDNPTPVNLSYELPINTPVAKTSAPPSTTCRAAEKVGVSM